MTTQEMILALARRALLSAEQGQSEVQALRLLVEALQEETAEPAPVKRKKKPAIDWSSLASVIKAHPYMGSKAPESWFYRDMAARMARMSPEYFREAISAEMARQEKAIRKWERDHKLPRTYQPTPFPECKAAVPRGPCSCPECRALSRRAA